MTVAVQYNENVLVGHEVKHPNKKGLNHRLFTSLELQLRFVVVIMSKFKNVMKMSLYMIFKIQCITIIAV